MPRFFIEGSPQQDTWQIIGADAHHMVRSLRMKVGDAITLCDGQGKDYDGHIVQTGRGCVTVAIEQVRPSTSEPRTKVTLFLALSKADKMELVVQKATEMGVHQMIPIQTARCVSRPDAVSLEKKIMRWNKIANEAAGQSGRGVVPTVSQVQSLAEAIDGAKTYDLALCLYEGTCPKSLRQSLTEYPKATSIALFFGPEGGWALDEVMQFEQAGIAPVSLGKRILRCETAPLVALTGVLYEYHELE